MPLFGNSTPTIAGKSDTRQRYNMVVMPALSGKSKIQGEMLKYTGEQRVICVDVDSLATGMVEGDSTLKALDTVSNSSVLEAMLFPKLQEKFIEILKTLEKDIVLAITSNTRFCDWLECKDKRIYVFLPAPELYLTMMKELEHTSGADASKAFVASRDNIVMWSKDKANVTAYTSLADISKALAEAFTLKLSAY